MDLDQYNQQCSKFKGHTRHFAYFDTKQTNIQDSEDGISETSKHSRKFRQLRN
uniref:Uncharacterized protein n=1 Tax=Magallana gigas TaxID=29159 RepID=K1PX60_MAGGI